MKRRIALKQNSNKGFTLVELLVVLVLMAIILSISIFSALGWIDWSKFRHQNAAAEDIFYAAQNQLTELDSSGALIRKVQDALWDANASIDYYEDREDVSYRKGNYNSSYILAQGKNSIDAEGEGAGLSTRFGNLKNSDGQPYAWDSSLWKDNNLANTKRTILTLSVDAGRYDKYSNKANAGEAITPGEKLLFDLIAPYIADKSVLNGSITIEFSPEAGQVFAVCYSDQADSFTYNTAPSGTEVSIADRNINTREAVMLGYYGVDTLTPKVRGRSRTVQAYRLEIDNGDTLNLKLGTISNNSNLLTDISLKYIIYGSTTYDNDNKKYDEIMSFTIPKAEIDRIRSYRTVQQAAQDPVSDIEVTFNKGLYANLSGKKFRMPMWLDDKGNIYLALDAADIQAQSVTYAKIFGYFEDGEAANDSIKTAKVNEAQAAFSKTFSFYRFGLPNIRFINAKVLVNPNTEKQGEAISGPLVGSDGVFVEHGIDTDKPHGTAVTFDEWKEEDASVEGGNDPLLTDKSYVYGIKNGRHFYNMRFESDYSDFIEKTTYVHENIKKTFDLRSDIDWKVFSEKAFLNSYILRSSNDSTDTDLTSGIDVCADVNRYELTYKDEDGNVIVPGFDTSKYPFPGFRMLSFGDTFKTETDETNPNKYYKLSNINITVAANSIYGVYGETVRKNMDQIKEAKNYNYETVNELGVAGGMPLGLFAENFGSIHDINLDKVSIKGVEGFPVESANPEGFIYTSKVGGFVGENFGTVQKLYIDKKDDAEGSAQTASETLSYISGRSDVGGIVGHQYFKAVVKTENGEVAANIKDCINNADVTGISYVGGIIGRVYMADSSGEGERSNYFDKSFTVNEDSGKLFSNRYIAPSVTFGASKYELKNIDTFTIESCKNRGEVSMHSDFVENTIPGYEMKRGFYFGGITGAAFNSVNSQNTSHTFDSDENEKLVIKDCDSCALYSESELMEILNPDMTDSDQVSETRRRLRQTFVGGIVGGIRYGTIEDCTTIPGTEEGEDKYSFVFGDRYVGGVAGYSQETVFTGSSEYIQAETEKNSDISDIASKTGHTYEVVNGTGAFGNYAIGGIAGAFGTPETSGLVPNFVGSEIEKAFSESDNYEYPVNAKCITNSGYRCNGLLNTALVLGYSFDAKLNQLNGGANDVNPTVGKYFYGVGGITGLLAETIDDADYVQSEETKVKYLELTCLNNIEHESDADGISNISSLLGSDSFTIDTLRSIIQTSEYTTDAVGGIAGHALEGGNLNKINGNTRYN